MRNLLLVIWFACLLPCVAVSADVDPSAVLAGWEGGEITVADFVRWWERIPAENRPALAALEERVEFLESMINARVMLQEADRLGIDKHPDILDWMNRRRSTMLREELLTQATAGRVEVTDAEVEALYAKRLTQVTARHIIVPTMDEAEELLDSLSAGVAFEDLAIRYSTCASGVRGGSVGTVRWGDFSDRWSSQAFRLEPGEVSPAFQVETGYGIVKVEAKTVMEPEDPTIERNRIRSSLFKQKTFEERKVFTDSLHLAYGVDLDMDAVVSLCTMYALELMKLGETREVVDIDVEPELTDAEREQPIVSYRGGTFTTGEIVDLLLAYPYAVRPRLDDPDEMVPFINRAFVDTLLIAEAEKRELDKLPKIAAPLEKIKQRRTTQLLFRYVTRDAEVPEEVLREHFEANEEAYTLPGGHTASKILLATKSAADSMMDLLDGGIPFEEVARRYSHDPFSAPGGGDLGFLPIGKDTEFDEFFSTMEVGDVKYFRSLEGQVILWLREKRQARPATFEEARSDVAKEILPAYRDQMLGEWVTRKRQEFGVQTDKSLLPKIPLGS
jgi:peptidyl-prolyl cis-trans isomerase C